MLVFIRLPAAPTASKRERGADVMVVAVRLLTCAKWWDP